MRTRDNAASASSAASTSTASTGASATGGATTGVSPTGGGTSDARFLSKLCPTVEFGLLNATMHKVDEAVAVDDLRALTRIYAGVIARAGA